VERGCRPRAWRPYLAPCSPRGSGDAKAKATVKATAKAKATAIIWSLRPSGFAPAFGREGCASQRDIFRWAKAPRYLKGNGNGNGNGKGKGVGGGNGNSADIQLWTVSDGHGFQVLQFAKSFTARHKDLFANTVTTEQSR